MNFFRGFLINNCGIVFITRAGDAKHKIKFQWPKYARMGQHSVLVVVGCGQTNDCFPLALLEKIEK